MSAAPSQVASVTSQKPQDAEPAMAVLAQERQGNRATEQGAEEAERRRKRRPARGNRVEERGREQGFEQLRAGGQGRRIFTRQRQGERDQQAERREPKSDRLPAPDHRAAPIRFSVKRPMASIMATRHAAMIAAAMSAAQICTVWP